jgi:lanosterol synthase
MRQNLPDLPKATTPLEAARNGYEFYKNLQAEDGHWPGEYGGVMFLFPGLVIGSYVTNMSFTHEEKLELVRLLINRAHPVDGGWGM